MCPRGGGGSTAFGITNGPESLPTWSIAPSGLVLCEVHFTQQELHKKSGKHPRTIAVEIILPVPDPPPLSPPPIFAHDTRSVGKLHTHSCTLPTQVNEKFDQLLQVLEEAEATSGLEPPAAKEGKTAAHACINGRRVEVLSRTIQVVKKLLQERREALAGVPPPADDTLAAVAAGVSNGWQEEAAEGPVLDGGFRSEVEENNNTTPLATETTAAAAAAASTHDVIDSKEAAAEGVDAQAEAAVAATMVAAPEGAAANHQALMHHVAMSVSGHHPSMMMAPGFTGVPGHPVPSPPHGIPGHPGGPIFFAVPMYIPQGQGMPAAAAATAAAENAAQAPAATAVAAPSLAATPAAAADPAPTPVAEAAAAPGVVDATEAVPAPSGKKTWAVPAGMGYQSMMTLQMPQFVTQALSGEEGSEKPTHAMCA